MKTVMILLIIGASHNLFSAESAQFARITRLKDKKTSTPIIHKGRSDESKYFKKLMENNEKIKELLRFKTSTPTIWEGNSQIQTGSVFRGTLLNSINSTNLSSPVLVQARENQGLPFKSKFSCQGVTNNKRVHILCNKMITNFKEVQISAQVLNIDGSSGLVGFYDDGKEDLIAGALISDFSAGVLSAASTKISTPFGNTNDNTVKNQIYQGLINSGKTTSDILLDEMKTKEPIVQINAGTSVLIYFMEAINEN